jgi:hypothetical protein
MFEYGFPPPRIVNSAVVLKSQRERRMVLSGILVRIRLPPPRIVNSAVRRKASASAE